MTNFHNKALFIIKAGETFSDIADVYGGFECWIQEKMADYSFPFRVIDAYKDEALPLAEQCAGVVISGSHAMSTDKADWSERIIDWIPHVIKEQIPFLGICYGHHLLARAFGGIVGDLPRGIEIGSVRINQTQAAQDDLLFNDLPEVFDAHVTHYQTILDPPENAVVLATSSYDRYQGIRVGPRAWGVQFHPEFSPEIMRAYINNQEQQLVDFGMNLNHVKKTVRKCDLSARILTSFGKLVATY